MQSAARQGNPWNEDFLFELTESPLLPFVQQGASVVCTLLFYIGYDRIMSKLIQELNSMKRKGLFVVLAVLLVMSLAGCQEETPKPSNTEQTQQSQEKPPVESLALVVTEEDISQLEQYPDLKTLDLTGSTCYGAIADYMSKHPQVAVTYTVSLGNVTVGNGTTELVLKPSDYVWETLLENLNYLPQMTDIQFPGTELTMEQITTLREAYPNLTVDYTVTLMGLELSASTAELDLTGLQPSQVEQTAQVCSLLPGLTNVELMDASGQSALSVEDVGKLCAAAPQAVFHYVFDLFGKTVSTTDERIEFVKQNIGNKGEQELRNALAILRGCSYLLLDDCGFDSEILAKAREDFPDTKVVWRIYAGTRNYMTDTEVLRAVYHVDDTNSYEMRYCNEVKYMDLGHNTEMTDLSFISFMPDLEIVILSGSPITDLSPFAGNENVEFLELAYCGTLKDVSPLAECPNLKYLNISYTKVKDLSVLKDLHMDRICYLGSGFSQSERETLKGQFPECWITLDGRTPYGKGWRYDDEGYTFSEIYKKVREVFNYDAIDAMIAAGAK